MGQKVGKPVLGGPERFTPKLQHSCRISGNTE